MQYIITTEQSTGGFGNINYNLLKITSNKEVAERFAKEHNDKADKSSGTYPKPAKCKIQEWDGKSQITLFKMRY